MYHWFHHLFSPHCIECQAERACPSCQILRSELDKTQRLNEQLLAKLLDKPAPPEVTIAPSNGVTVGKPLMSWTQRRQILEAESRDAARKLQEREKEMTVEEIEKEIGVS